MFLDFSEQLVSFMDVSCACGSRSRVWFFYLFRFCKFMFDEIGLGFV